MCLCYSLGLGCVEQQLQLSAGSGMKLQQGMLM